MPTQPIRSVTTILAIVACTCIQFSGGLSAQDASSRRASREIITAPAIVSAPNAQTELLVQQVTEKSNSSAQPSLPQISKRRKQTETQVVLGDQNFSSDLRVPRTTSLQPAPSIVQVGFVADQVPVPSLEDPEMFRVPTVDYKLQGNSGFQPMSDQLPQGYANAPNFNERFPRSKGAISSLPVRQNQMIGLPVGSRRGAGNFVLPQQQNKDRQYAAARQTEDSLLDRLPISNLHEGIVSDPVSQATTRGTVGDPYLNSRSYGDDLRATTSVTTKTWRSPNMRHRPLYFEETNLERFGHTHPRLQPFISGAHFFSSVALLPYKTGVTPASTCQYPIGYNRPGDCVSTVREQHPLNPRAALRQAAVVVGGIAGL